ncbi:MAG: DUF2846 domain-containing protein [Gammaproteobacteria bacterium]|nr:DUF2846 domain-containing protein [Gammaproteobacteria bacterium]
MQLDVRRRNLQHNEENTRAKTFLVDAGRSNIYLFKSKLGEGESGRISINGKTIGKLETQTFFMRSVEPGSYKISSVGEETSKLAIEVMAGKNYFIWHDVVTGSTFGGRTKVSYKLKQISEDDGKKNIKESRMLSSSF